MDDERCTAYVADHRPPRSADEARERRRRIMTRGRASLTRGIADAVVLKHGDVFFLSEPGGVVPLTGSHGLGLYYRDCRYLDGYDIQFAGDELNVLSTNAAPCDHAVHELTNPDIRLPDGRLLEKETLGLRWDRRLEPIGRSWKQRPSLPDRRPPLASQH